MEITESNLPQFVQQFADDNGVQLPAAVDPDGKFKAAVAADYALGKRLGIVHTPTVFVITSGKSSRPFVEEVDRDELSAVIEDMQKKAVPPPSQDESAKPHN